MFRRYAYGILTLIFFLGALVLHWHFAWLTHVNEALQHGQAPELGTWAVEVARDTFENWQSEFLQLLWQVGGLAYFLYVGSPASKENDDRMEAKIDALLRQLPDGDRLREELDEKYLRHHGHAKPHAHTNT